MGFAASPASLPHRRGHALLRAEPPPQHCLVCSNLLLPQGSPSEGASLSCKVLLSAHGPFLSAATPSGGLGFFANVVVHFLSPSLCSVEAPHGRRWPELPVSSCDPHPSQPHSSAALRLLRGLCSRQLCFPGHLWHCCEYLLPSQGSAHRGTQILGWGVLRVPLATLDPLVQLLLGLLAGCWVCWLCCNARFTISSATAGE